MNRRRSLKRLLESLHECVCPLLSPRLDAARPGPGAFIKAVERTLARHHPDESRPAHFEVKFPEADGAVVEFEVSSRVVSQGEVLPRLHTKWRLRFEPEGDAWKVTRLEPVPMPTSPLSSLNDALQSATRAGQL